MRIRPAFDRYPGMPVFPEEPEIHESIPGPGVPFPHKSDASSPRTPSANPAASGVVPGQRPASPRPAPPRPAPPRAAGATPGPRPGPKPAPGPRPSSPAVRLVPADPQEALDRADETVDQLLESGRRPGDVLVLTVGEPHPWQQHELSFGEERYWAQLAEADDVFYADAATGRPLRREVVVLVVNASGVNRIAGAAVRAAERAGSLLVICGGTDAVASLFPGADRPVPA